MDWGSLIGPAVVAAGVSGVISVIGLVVTTRTARTLHADKLKFDERLAERKFESDKELAERKFRFDKELAEHRVQLDAALAEKKFAFDKAMIAWRRRYELAEQVLAAAYEARDALSFARARLIWSGEGKTRVATEPESDQVREARDSAFIPIERLAAHSKAFATLQTLQDPMLSHFGPEVMRPISALFEVHHGITTASSILMQMAEAREAREDREPILDELWGDKAQESNAKVDAAIERLETMLKPILSAQAPA